MTIRTVRRLVRDEDICRQLAQVPHPKSGGPIFRTFRELAVFAATVGFEQQRRVPLSGPTDVFVDGRIMESSETVMDMVYLLGLAAERRQEVLSDDPAEQEKLASVFEEYARRASSLLPMLSPACRCSRPFTTIVHRLLLGSASSLRWGTLPLPVVFSSSSICIFLG